MNVIDLNKFKDCFKDTDAFLHFGEQFSEAIQHDLRPIMLNGQIIGSSLSADGTKSVLYERIVKTITTRPEILDELIDRFDMPIVE